MDEERDWVGSVLFSLFLPHQVVLTVFSAVSAFVTDQYFQWDWAYVERNAVVLYFEQEQLTRWEVIKPSYSYSGGYDPCTFGAGVNSCFPTTFPTKDSKHHAKGHKHHHGH